MGGSKVERELPLAGTPVQREHGAAAAGPVRGQGPPGQAGGCLGGVPTDGFPRHGLAVTVFGMLQLPRVGCKAQSFMGVVGHPLYPHF